MKPLIIIACIISLSASSNVMAKGPGRNLNRDCIHVISMSDNMFYFKSDKSVEAAVIDVYDHKTGEKVISQVITGKKTIVDLFFLEPGDYIIMITKGEFTRKYVYHNK